MAKNNNSGSMNEVRARLVRDGGRLAEETAAGQMLLDHKLAESLIEYGKRTETPEALVVAAQILSRHPVKAVDATAKREEAKRIRLVLDQAITMRPDDKVVKALIKRIDDVEVVTPASGVMLSSKLRVLRIDRGKHIRLNPDPRFDAQTAARVVASAEGNSMIGITVRRTDLKREKRSVSRGHVSAVWNSGIQRKAWDIRIFNLSGPDNLKVRVETS